MSRVATSPGRTRAVSGASGQDLGGYNRQDLLNLRKMAANSGDTAFVAELDGILAGRSTPDEEAAAAASGYAAAGGTDLGPVLKRLAELEARERRHAAEVAAAAVQGQSAMAHFQKTEKLAESLLKEVDEAKAAISQAKPIEIRQPSLGLAPVVTANLRPIEREMIDCIATGQRNILLSGPKGSGKSTLPYTIAKALGREVVFISCSEDMPGSVWTGMPDVQGRWHESAFAENFDKPVVCVLDEFDAPLPQTTLALNAPLGNGLLAIPRHPAADRRCVNRHPEHIVIAGLNTAGFGPTAEFCGRNPIDQALMDRFLGGEFMVNYDRDLEREMLKARPVLADRLWQMRALAVEHKLKRVVGTRAFVAAARLVAAGWDDQRVLDRLTVMWRPEEKLKCGLQESPSVKDVRRATWGTPGYGGGR